VNKKNAEKSLLENRASFYAMLQPNITFICLSCFLFQNESVSAVSKVVYIVLHNLQVIVKSLTIKDNICTLGSTLMNFNLGY